MLLRWRMRLGNLDEDYLSRQVQNGAQ